MDRRNGPVILPLWPLLFLPLLAVLLGGCAPEERTYSTDGISFKRPADVRPYFEETQEWKLIGMMGPDDFALGVKVFRDRDMSVEAAQQNVLDGIRGVMDERRAKPRGEPEPVEREIGGKKVEGRSVVFERDESRWQVEVFGVRRRGVSLGIGVQWRGVDNATAQERARTILTALELERLPPEPEKQKEADPGQERDQNQDE